MLSQVKQLKKELQVAVGAKNLAELTLRNSVMRQVELEVKVQKEREKSQQLQRELAEIKEEIVKVKEAHEVRI